MAGFELQVTFTGLCLYLVHTSGKQIAVLQPDCRKVLGNSPVHVDGTIGVPHIGYVTFDAAHLDLPIGALAGGEFIHRFGNRQVLDLGLPATTDSVRGKLRLPEFEQIANEKDSAGTFIPLLEPEPRLFSTNSAADKAPPLSLLMRTVLEGGELTTDKEERWRFSKLLSRDRPVRYMELFRSTVTWKRSIADSKLAMSVYDFTGDNRVDYPLKPLDGVISLKVANLCAENPLEWDHLEQRSVTGDDLDFKWLYRLVRPTQARSYEELLLGCPLPVPQRPDEGTSGVEDCFGASLSVQLFD